MPKHLIGFPRVTGHCHNEGSNSAGIKCLCLPWFEVSKCVFYTYICGVQPCYFCSLKGPLHSLHKSPLYCFPSSVFCFRPQRKESPELQPLTLLVRNTARFQVNQNPSITDTDTINQQLTGDFQKKKKIVVLFLLSMCTIIFASYFPHRIFNNFHLSLLSGESEWESQALYTAYI